MNTKSTLILVISSALSFPIAAVNAADEEQKPQTEQIQQKEQAKEQEQKMIYGWELMTVQERTAHREKMRSLKTEAERTAYRQEHHKLMQQRAKEKGVTIPDEPGARGSGRGFGGGGQGAGGGGQGK